MRWGKAAAAFAAVVLAGPAVAATVGLAWDPSERTDDYQAHYRVHGGAPYDLEDVSRSTARLPHLDTCRDDDGDGVLDICETTWSGLPDDADRLYFVVTALNEGGSQRSEPSNEVYKDFAPPPAPGGLEIVVEVNVSVLINGSPVDPGSMALRVE